ncbi:acyltransferase family protein [Ralstonia insidiosa]|uniref:acyltransferase family protein n=1 Tax=Ralstonia insidiosa TaxID=190721 RepID=UPI000CED84EA|nr:acyltransferase [Ralstonia insidiosa]
MREIKGLTGLRGIAALWVCIYHYTYENDFGSILTPLAHAGHFGVPVFFVLSGFILAYTYAAKIAAGKVPYARFLCARITRIYPLHLLLWLALGLATVLGFYAPSATDTREGYIAGLFMMHAWGFTLAAPWNNPSWSVSTEFAAYLLFPLFAGRLYRAGSTASWLLIIGVLAIFASAILNPIVAAIGVHELEFMYGGGLPYWLLMFAAGVALFVVTHRAHATVAPWVWDAIAAAGLLLLLVPLVVGGVEWWTLILASMLIVSGIYGEGPISVELFGNPAATWLGALSYALYLSHQLLVHVWVNALSQLMPGVWFHEIPLVWRLAVAISFAAALHYCFERPLRAVSAGIVGSFVGNAYLHIGEP